MSLSGDLQQFPIIDVIQLLHGSRKSGLFRLSGEKGESQLVFQDGDLVSANFLNNRVRIGQILVSSGAITEEQLDQALEIQINAGIHRKPLISTLLEHDMVDEAAAYNGIKSLIEMTIVEVLTWKQGRFSLDVARRDNTHGYHIPSTQFTKKILLNSQRIMMDPLRIFDEKVRNGTMDEILSIAGISNVDLEDPQSENNAPVITSEGRDQSESLSALRQLLAEKRSIIQRGSDQSYRSVDTLKKLIVEEFPTAAKELKRQLLARLAASSPDSPVPAAPPKIAVIVITRSTLLSTMVRSICFQEGVYVVSSDDITSLYINIRLLLCQTIGLVVIIDVPHDDSAQDTLQICMDLQQYPQASVVLAACSHFWDTQGLKALSLGVRSIIPRHCKSCSEKLSAQKALAFCSELGNFLRTLSSEYRNRDEQRFFTCISRLRTCNTLTNISFTVLAYLREVFERAIVFLVNESELVAVHSFGVKGDKSEGIVSLSDIRIPHNDQLIFKNVITTGQLYYGFHSDSICPHNLYRLISRLESPEVLLFPLIRANTVIAFIYADFGSKPASYPSLHYLDALLHYTTAQISVSAYRHKLKSVLEQQSTQGSAGA